MAIKGCQQDSYYMRLALEQAVKAYECDEVPVGAVLVYCDRIIAVDHDRREELQDITAHAELLCIRRANHLFQSWRLEDCRLYVTLEPCVMCASALIQARVSSLVYGASSPKFGAIQLYDYFNNPSTLYQVDVTGGLMADESASLLQQFFRQKR